MSKSFSSSQSSVNFLNETTSSSGLQPRNAKDPFILTRTSLGVVANFPQLIFKHSFTGFEWGYTGSGPADTALNILYITLTELNIDSEKAQDIAEDLYQKFKQEVIAQLDRTKLTVVVPYDIVVMFIADNI